MNLVFVTGSDAAFFNSMLVFLQAFAERLPGQRLWVADFGFTPAQAQFLRDLGLLLERPPTLEPHGVFVRKAALLTYLRHNGRDLGPDDALVWLDADLTLMETLPADFEAVGAGMTAAGVDIAVCPEPLGRSLGQMLSGPNQSAMAPTLRVIAAVGIDQSLRYVSSGLFFCRDPGFLTRWQELTRAVAEHPLFEQNMFNVTLHEARRRFLILDCEEWQAQGWSLDRVRLVPSESGDRPAARIGDKNIKTLHATSPGQGHLLIGNCRLVVRDMELAGPFKLFMAEELRLHQLQLLALFFVAHREALLRCGVCTPAARPIEGFEFVTL